LRPVALGVSKGFLRDNLEIVLSAVMLILFFKTFVGQQFVIPSPSRRNTLMLGDHVLVKIRDPQFQGAGRLRVLRIGRARVDSVARFHGEPVE